MRYPKPERPAKLPYGRQSAHSAAQEASSAYVVPELRLTAAHSPQEAFDALGDWLLDIAADAPEPAATVAREALRALPLLVDS